MKQLFLLCVILGLSLNGQVPNEVYTQQNALDKFNAEQQWIFAEGLFTRKWYVDAIKEYDAIVRNAGDGKFSQDARWRLYECHVQLGKGATAIKRLSAFVNKEKNDERRETGRMALARLLYAEKKVDAALIHFEDVDKKINKGAFWEAAQLEVARIYAEKGQQGEAFLRLQFLAKLPFDGENDVRAYAMFSYACLQNDRKKITEALEQYERLLVDGVVGEVAENAWYNKGIILFEQNKIDEAEKCFAHIIKIFQKGSFVGLSVNQSARCMLSKSRYVEALDVLKLNSAATGRVSLECNYLSAFASYQLKDYAGAINLFNVCIANNDEVYREDAWYYKLHCLFEWGKAERVLELVPQLEKLFAKSAYLADVYFLAGGASKKENKFEPAIVYYRQALSVFVGAWESVDACHYALAEVLKSLKKYGEEALVWQDLAKRENSNFRSEAMLNGAEAWIAAQNSNKALLLLQNYAKDFPRGSEIFFVKKRIAEVLIEAGRYADASTFIMELLKGEKLVVKESQRLRAVLGQVYYLQKNYSAAVKSLLLVWQTTDLQEDLRLEVGVYLGYSNISLKKEADAAKILAVIALMSNGLSKMLEEAEELDVARLLERFHYLQAADAIYTRVSKSKALKNKLQSLLGLGRTAMERQKHAVALKLLGKVLDLCAKANLAERVSALSLQGEIYSILNKHDQAYQTFEFALRLKGGDQRSMCRILYGMAQLLKQREDYTESRRYANRVFIMYKDPLYAPKALFLSVQLLHIKGKLKEEKQILRELKQNFPLYFAKIEVQDYLKEHGIKSD